MTNDDIFCHPSAFILALFSAIHKGCVSGTDFRSGNTDGLKSVPLESTSSLIRH
jgi:hypothetical protein